MILKLKHVWLHTMNDSHFPSFLTFRLFLHHFQTKTSNLQNNPPKTPLALKKSQKSPPCPPSTPSSFPFFLKKNKTFRFPPNHLPNFSFSKVTTLPDQIMEGIVVDTNRSIGKRCHKTSDGMIYIHLLTQSGDKEISTSVRTTKKK